jgi:hypothetical protein
MSYMFAFTYKLTKKFLAADIFDGRLEKFDLKEVQWEYNQRGARYPRVSDGKDEVTVEVELDGTVEYVGHRWYTNGGRGYYPGILEKLVKALNTEAEEVYFVYEDDLKLLHYCAEHGIDSGLAYDGDDPLRHEKWIEWKRSGRHAKAEAAAHEARKEAHSAFRPCGTAPVVPRSTCGSATLVTDVSAAVEANRYEPEADVAADLAWASASPSAHTARIVSLDGTEEHYIRQQGGRWTLLFSEPVLAGWCPACGAPSTWRFDPLPRAPKASAYLWRCVRCESNGKVTWSPNDTVIAEAGLSAQPKAANPAPR